MDTELVTLQLPARLYEQLQELATQEHTDLVSKLAQLVTDAYQRKTWLQDLTALRQQIKNEGGLRIGETKEREIAQLHQTRQEIFETEYANLYR